uniref:Uncharacterized protein n=1 Tax=Streptomyces sp. NBC_01393 TaxID=2903851 RepID=A0AAU3I2F8_9ACTN
MRTKLIRVTATVIAALSLAALGAANLASNESSQVKHVAGDSAWGASAPAHSGS